VTASSLAVAPRIASNDPVAITLPTLAGIVDVRFFGRYGGKKLKQLPPKKSDEKKVY